MSESFLFKIWGVLLAILFLSIAIGRFVSPGLATVLIFGLATVKAYLVAAYYMGLKREPFYVTGILATGVIFMAILFGYLIPDIVNVYGRMK